MLRKATWRSGYATVCKTVYPGSIPGVASSFLNRQANSIRWPHHRRCALIATNFGRDRAARQHSTSKRHCGHPLAGPRRTANPDMMGFV
jgi:hypothetical protein